MNTSTSVAFRVDANPEIGLGHLRRCLTLADQLHQMGCKTHFVCREISECGVRRLGSHALSRIDGECEASRNSDQDDERRDADCTLSVLSRDASRPSWVVVDSYRLGREWEQRIQERGLRVMAIDDFRDRVHSADLLVSDSDVLFASSAERGMARVLAGPRFALIGPEYTYVASAGPSIALPRRVLVSYGGSDPTNETVKAVRALELLLAEDAASPRIGGIDIVVGPLSRHVDENRTAAKALCNAVVHTGVDELAPLMRSADLILTAGGNTMVEALAMRKPCLVTITADNQTLMVEQLAKAGVIHTLGSHRDVTQDGVRQAVATCLDALAVFAKHVASAPVFDTLGAQRIATAILGAKPSNGDSLT